MAYTDKNSVFDDSIQELSRDEIEVVRGARDVFTDISIALGAATTVAGGAAAIPTPASPALASFAVLTGLMSAGAAYLSSIGAGNPPPAERRPNRQKS